MSAKSKFLVIVESPAKAKTIKKYLGPNYTVKASVGHVMDLPVSKLGVDIDNDFSPTYVILKGKKTVLSEIGKAAKDADKILLAPDPDREGEAIAKHIADYISSKLKEEKPIYRIMVNEITSKGLKHAISAPKEIDLDKFNSQQARRVLDRLVGYQISPILWKKVRRGLSAGRVQSVAVRLIVERERDINDFKPVEYWNIDGKFLVKDSELEARLIQINDKKAEVSDSKQAEKIVSLTKKGTCSISKVEKKEKRRKPQPPFTTSKLQQDASRKLRFTPKKTMAVAQGLYEGVELGENGFEGLITYMRTDSVRVSNESLDWARTYIEKEYGKEYLPEKPNVYKTKKAAQDAHEAIRPTNPDYSPELIKSFLSADQYKLYSMIWNRFIASQMEASVYDQTSIDIKVLSSDNKYIFRATGSILKFAGYEKVYMDFRDEEDSEDREGQLPDCTNSDHVELKNLDSVQKYTQPPARYNYATIIKDLEERGIGRPSTYASIISTIQERGYVEKQANNQLMPTELGKVITELLVESFPRILDVDFTAGMEDELDRIEEGKSDWIKVLKDFYKDFEGSLKLAVENMRDIKKEETPTDVDCELCGNKMVIKWGRMGQFLACTEYPKCKGTMNFKMDENGEIKAEEKEISDEKCPQCEGEMAVKQGRFGKFLACLKYPECKGTKSFSTGIKCPECGEGEISERRTRKGKPFYSCSRYPDCKFAMWSKPVSKSCPKCGMNVMEEKKDCYQCVNEECKHKEMKV